MSRSSDAQQEGAKPSDAPPSPTPSQPSDTKPESAQEDSKALAEAINNVLKGIPFIGPYIVIVKLKWGWTGILLLIGGFVIATVLTFTGLFPESVVSDRYKNSPITSQTGNGGHELKPQQDISWDTVVHNARIRIWASGVALTKLNPRIVSNKVKEGVTAQFVYVNPCGDTIDQRQTDESNQNAAEHIRSNLRTFDNYTRDLSPAQKNSLQVKLTNAYPTMVVIIIDEDLYAYFCPYGAVCSDSPVLVFKGYRGGESQNTAAKFFESHFIAISNNANLVTNYREPCSISPP